jgi:hypothetical protein
MSAIVDYIASLPDDAEEVDLSTFEGIEELDESSWTKIKRNKVMKRVKLPPSLRTIRACAFQNCKQLKEVTFPSSLRSIKNAAFLSCRLLKMKDFKVPESLEELGDSAFHGCIEISGKLSTHITGRFSFADCESIRR